MGKNVITRVDRALARLCETCPACRSARKTQSGIAFWLVSRVETKVCPFCRAYEKVNGHKAQKNLIIFQNTDEMQLVFHSKKEV